MLKLLRLFVVLAAAAALALLVGSDGERAASRARFVAPLSAQCDAAVTSGATGCAFVDMNAASGRITFSWRSTCQAQSLLRTSM